MRQIRSAPIVLLALAAACNDSSTDIEGPGTFDAEVTGEVTATVNGSAVFGQAAATESGNGFVLSLVSRKQTGSGRPEQVVVFIHEAAERPPVGTLDLLDMTAWRDTAAVNTYPAGPYGLFVDFTGALVPIYSSAGGELSITESTETRLAGTFQFPGEVLVTTESGTDTLEVQVTGSFEAVAGTPAVSF
jgi:hypothetical protein